MISKDHIDRREIFPEPELPRGSDLLSEGQALARDWSVEKNAFMAHHDVASEYAYKKRCIADGRVMQHAQVGFRDVERTCEAYRTVWNECIARDVVIDRIGICLDWSMAVPRDQRAKATRGTGMILSDPETCARLTSEAPAAPHFGDFVLGFPAAIENTQLVLAGGSTVIGNFGQYFTFRVPRWDDDIETTRATLVALGLIAGQREPILVHSNIDDGFAAQFTDLTSALGMMEIERQIVEDMIGAKMGHCFGHHFSDPLTRLAFQRASAGLTDTPGTMIYGNTTSYRGTDAENYASLARYLNVDAIGQSLKPTGHAVNAVPVTENERIPDIHEIVDAQLFCGRLIQLRDTMLPLIELDQADQIVDLLVDGAVQFKNNVLAGLEAGGINISDPFELMLALRRVGARQLESLFGVGSSDASYIGGREPVVPGSVLEEIGEMADVAMAEATPEEIAVVRSKKMRVIVATTDVHEHGKLLIEEILRRIGVEVIDGGVSTDVEKLIAQAAEQKPDAVAVSTYNGVALTYYTDSKTAMADKKLDIPFLIGGRLNQIPEDSNSSLPVDVGDQLSQSGAIVCRAASEIVSSLQAIAEHEANP
ncbi:MAG: hypothetical protein GY948_19880 [Alphaproteobacteria bacterium]|nr:hypothetical protein [Alphaproteobacteria bacterium]